MGTKTQGRVGQTWLFKWIQFLLFGLAANARHVRAAQSLVGGGRR